VEKDDPPAKAITLHDRFAGGGHDRRGFINAMMKLVASAAAARLLAGSVTANPAVAAMVAEDDKRLDGRMVHWPGAAGHQLFGYMAIPKKHPRKPAAVLVLHDSRGLQADMKDVARRLAVAGFIGLALDVLAPQGGTPADEERARQMIGALDLAEATADGVATINWLSRHRLLNGKVGVLGFGWGGTMADRLAVAAGPALSACVAYYGPPPPPAEAGKVKAAVMLHDAGTGDGGDAGAAPWSDALRAAGVDVRHFDYPGTQHGFDNETLAARYDGAAAALSWRRTLAFFREKLA